MTNSVARDLVRTYSRRNALVLGAHILIAVKGVVLVPLLVKTFGTEVYGTYVLLVGMVGFVFGISSCGAGYSFTRHAPSTDDRRWRAALFYGAVLFHLTAVVSMAVMLLLVHPLVETLLLKGRFPFPLWPVVLLLVVQTLLHHYSNYFRYTHRVRTYVLVTGANAYLFLAIIYLIVRMGGDLDVGQMILLQAGAAAVVVPLPIILATGELRLPRGLLKRYDLRADLRVGFPVVLMFVVVYTLSNSDRLVLALFAPVESVGAYNVAYLVGTLAIMVPNSLGVAVPALLARAADTAGPTEVARLMSISLRTVLLFSVPYVVGTVVYGRDVLALFTNEEIAHAAYPATIVAASSVIFYGLFTVRGFLLYVEQRTVTLFVVSASAAGVNLALNFAMLPFYPDILVPAATTLIAYLTAHVIARRQTAAGVPGVSASFLIKVVAASGAIAVFRPLVTASGSAAVLVACVIGSGLLCVGLLILFRAIPLHVITAVLQTPRMSSR